MRKSAVILIHVGILSAIALLALELMRPEPKPIEVVIPHYVPAVELDPFGECAKPGELLYSKESRKVFRCAGPKEGFWTPIKVEAQ